MAIAPPTAASVYRDGKHSNSARRSSPPGRPAPPWYSECLYQRLLRKPSPSSMSRYFPLALKAAFLLLGSYYRGFSNTLIESSESAILMASSHMPCAFSISRMIGSAAAPVSGVNKRPQHDASSKGAENETAHRYFFASWLVPRSLRGRSRAVIRLPVVNVVGR